MVSQGVGQENLTEIHRWLESESLFERMRRKHQFRLDENSSYVYKTWGEEGLKVYMETLQEEWKDKRGKFFLLRLIPPTLLDAKLVEMR